MIFYVFGKTNTNSHKVVEVEAINSSWALQNAENDSFKPISVVSEYWHDNYDKYVVMYETIKNKFGSFYKCMEWVNNLYGNDLFSTHELFGGTFDIVNLSEFNYIEFEDVYIPLYALSDEILREIMEWMSDLTEE